ncbi:MAG: beta-class carbonic anhydrase [Terriglobia bacterium]
MNVIDEVLKANEDYSHNFTSGNLPMPPGRKLAVLACMDARLVISRMLGLKEGDAHMIRNADGIVDDDTLRSLIISHYLLGTQEFMLIHHTDCGMLTFKDNDLHARLRKETGTAAVSPNCFYSFSDLEADVREQIAKLKSHPWIPKSILIRGFIFDVKTGRLREVPAARAGEASA